MPKQYKTVTNTPSEVEVGEGQVLLRFSHMGRDRMYKGVVTKTLYRAGARTRFVAVDERDVPAFLSRTRNRKPIFEVHKKTKTVEIPEGDSKKEEPEKHEFIALTALNGVGESTAQTFIDAGIKEIADLLAHTPAELDEVFEAADVPKKNRPKFVGLIEQAKTMLEG